MRGPLPYLLVAVALAKLAIVLVNGPSFEEDSGLYVQFADAILDHGRAFAPVAWGAQAVPPFVFRMAGYPLVIAGAKALAPQAWAYFLVLVQGLLDLGVIALFYRVARALLGSTIGATAAALLYACSGSLLWDNAIVSDSLYASCTNIVLFLLLGHLLSGWRLSTGRSAALGALWGFAIWTRDTGLYFTILPVILLAAATRRRRDAWLGRAAPLLAFLVVAGGMVGAYVALNWYRTGEAFLSITGEENWLRPLFDMKALGYADPFTGDDFLSRTVRDTMTSYDFPAQERFVVAAQLRCRCTPTELQAMMAAKFRTQALRHPMAYLRVALRNFNYVGLASDLADPVFTLNQFTELGTRLGRRIVPEASRRNLRALAHDFSFAGLGLLVLAALSSSVAAALFALFLFGIPWVLWRERKSAGARDWAAGFLWLDFMTVSVAFSLIHYEARHALPVFPAAQAGMVYAVMRLAAFGRRAT